MTAIFVTMFGAALRIGSCISAMSAKLTGINDMHNYIFGTCRQNPLSLSHQNRSLQSSCQARHLSAGRQAHVESL